MKNKNTPKLIGKVEKTTEHNYKVWGENVTTVKTNFQTTNFNMRSIPYGTVLGYYNNLTEIESK